MGQNTSPLEMGTTVLSFWAKYQSYDIRNARMITGCAFFIAFFDFFTKFLHKNKKTYGNRAHFVI